MKKRVLGIKWKVFSYLLAFCVLMLVILAMFQTVFLNRFYVMVKQSQVKNEIKKISEEVKELNWNALQKAPNEVHDIFVEVWDSDNQMVQTTGVFQRDIHARFPLNEREELYEKLRSGDGAITEYDKGANQDGPGMESLFSAQLVEAKDGNTYMVIVSAGLSPVESVVGTIRVQLILISIIMIVLSIIIALIISKKISIPIVNLSKKAEKLGKGNYEMSFHEAGYKEVVQLSDTLDSAARELGQTEELRRELIANVSHDLRTPLTLIAGYSEMMQDIPEEATPENLQIIIEESKRLSLLVNDLLDLSKLQAGTYKMSIEDFDLQELTGEIVGRVSRFYEQDGVIIHYQCTEAEMVNGDRERISQVIYNFILNAILHTDDSKEVYVSLERKDNRVRLSVTDKGPGIEEEKLPYIWDRYYKIEKNFTRSEKGTGLGLSIVKSILDHHPDITYGVESEKGKGSTFWFETKLISIKKE